MFLSDMLKNVQGQYCELKDRFNLTDSKINRIKFLDRSVDVSRDPEIIEITDSNNNSKVELPTSLKSVINSIPNEKCKNIESRLQKLENQVDRSEVLQIFDSEIDKIKEQLAALKTGNDLSSQKITSLVQSFANFEIKIETSVNSQRLKFNSDIEVLSASLSNIMDIIRELQSSKTRTHDAIRGLDEDLIRLRDRFYSLRAEVRRFL